MVIVFLFSTFTTYLYICLLLLFIAEQQQQFALSPHTPLNTQNKKTQHIPYRNALKTIFY